MAANGMTPSSHETRKTVTVLFCDLTGSTALGEELDPETLRELVQRYFAEMRTLIEQHGGTVEKFIGDAVLAVFGVPRVHEDDALRAIRAAVAMQEALIRLSRQWEQNLGVRIQARIAVNTGEVVAGDPESGQSFVSGDAVNAAARLEEAAAPGEILLGPTTYRLVRSAVIAQPLEPLELRGKQERVTAYRLSVVEPGADILPRRFDAPLVGRSAKLAAIGAAFEAAVATSSCRSITVVGHAGVGKSRLVQELVALRGDAARVFRGRCLPYGEGITFWPVVEMLQEAADLDQAGSPEEARERIAATLSDEEDVVVDRLAAIVGLGGRACGIQDTFWAIRRWLENQATSRPLLVVFDDIQWAESAFLDLVQYLATFATDRPILLLCLARPELFEVRPDWASVGPVIQLNPLELGDGERLVAGLLGESMHPEELERQIVESAGGNPLFIEETVRMLVDDGLLAREDGRWVAHGDLSRAGAPETVQAVIAARLDRLDEPERATLQRASVIGEVFWWGAVAELSGDDLAMEAGRTLQALVRKELIRPDPTTFAGEDAFRFGHLLIRDVAYESLPKRIRADLHTQFASWLESRSGDRAEEIVGYHAERAYKYFAELGLLDERAAALSSLASERLADAGLRSYHRGDMPAATNLLSRALALLSPQAGKRLDLLHPLAVALGETGRLEEAEERLEEAIEGGRAIGDSRVEHRAIVRRHFLRLLRTPMATHQEAVAAVEQAIPVFEEQGDDAGLAESFRLLGIIRLWAGATAESLELLDRAADHARLAGDRRLELDALHWMNTPLTEGPTAVPEAISRIRASLQGREDDPTFRCQALRYLADLEGMRGRFSEAAALLAEAKELGYQLGLTVDLAAGILRVSGHLAWLAGDPRAAEAELQEAFDTLKRIGDTGHLASVAGDLALVLVEVEGRERDAFALTEMSTAWLLEEDVDAKVRWGAARARALARLGDLTEAERLADETVARAWAADYFDLRALSLEALADVLERAGRTEDAAEALRKAVAVHEAKGNVVSAATTREVLERLEARL